MYNATDYFVSKLGRQPVQEINDQSGFYSMWDDGSVECEAGEFLTALVRITKPTNILETGTYHGYSTAYLATGVKENGFGRVETIEWEAQHINEAIPLWQKLELDQFITHYNLSSLEFKTDKQYQLVLLDTEPQTRFQELERFWDNFAPGSVIVIHDLSWDLGAGAPQFWLNRELLEKRILAHELQVVNFHTPRGLTIFYRPREKDEVYKLLKK